jgi:uncharacterized protein (TIGR04255 family)
MGEKLTKAPVFLTAAQIRHNPILSLDEEYAAHLQEKFRKIGFPDYRLNQQPGFEIDVSDQARVRVNQKMTSQHSYLNRDGTACFIVETSRLYFQVTDYDVFETFSEQFLQGILLFHDVVTIDYVDAVSIRLLDAIIPGEDEDISDYVVQSLLGIRDNINEEGWVINHCATEAVMMNNEHKIIIKTLARGGALAVPPDLNINSMMILPRFKDHRGVHLILDTDCAYETRESFDLDKIKSRLRLLKDNLRTIFRTAVTEHALKKWS